LYSINKVLLITLLLDVYGGCGLEMLEFVDRKVQAIKIEPFAVTNWRHEVPVKPMGMMANNGNAIVDVEEREVKSFAVVLFL
jgi:hypothetical protein